MSRSRYFLLSGRIELWPWRISNPFRHRALFISSSACSAGTYQDYEGASTCFECSVLGQGHASRASSAACDLCGPGFYRDGDGCIACPTSANCQAEAGVTLPAPKRGYWVDIHSMEERLKLFRCPRLTCKGSSPESSTCWESNVTSCDADKLLCAQGSSGPLCGSCEPGFVYSSSTLTCVSCTGSLEAILVPFFSVLAVVGLAAALYTEHLTLPGWIMQSWFAGTLRQLFLDVVNNYSGQDRVLYSSYQIIASVS